MMLAITLIIVTLMALFVTYLAWKGMKDDLDRPLSDFGDRWIRRK